MKMKVQAMYALRTSALCVALALVCATRGSAQMPDLPEVPEGLNAAAKAKLDSERQRLVAEESRIRASWAAHEKKCKRVTAGSSEHTACVTLRDPLIASARNLRAQKDAFRADLQTLVTAELKQLAEEENALSQAIHSGLETLRTMVSDTSATSQLPTLEELRKKIQRLTRVREVRRTMAILAVRG